MLSGLNKIISGQKAIVFLCVILIFSCKEKTNTHAETVTVEQSPSVVTAPPLLQDSFKKGEVRQLACLNNAANTYAVYLPASYNKANPLPIVYFFDPHADGALPVTRYKTLADEFNFILAGSNQSKNGMQLQESQSIAAEMIADLQNRFFIQQKLQYAGGFSGGSKVACAVAATQSSMAGLIACSGSYINNGQPFQPALNIASIAGERDFNYHEMVQFNNEVSSTNAHLFITTDNTHEWPPLDAMKDAFVFMMMRGMQKQTFVKNDTQVKSLFEAERKKGSVLEKQSNVYGACMHYQNMIATFKDLADVSFAEQKITAIEKSPAYNTYLEKKQTLDNQEPQFQQYYAEAMQSKDIAWWNNEIDKLKKSADLKSDKLWSAYNSRMLGFLGIMCYSYSGKAVKANVAEASKFLSIYKTVEPDNTESYFLSAIYAANNSNVESAAQELKLALQKGFSDKQRLNEYPSLSAVIYRADIKAMLDTIH